MIYDKFQPLTVATQLPRGYFKADLIYDSGAKLENQMIDSASVSFGYDVVVAIRIHKPVDPLEQLKSVVLSEISHYGYDREAVRFVISHLVKTGRLKVDVNPDKPWIEHKLDELSIISSHRRDAIIHWFNHPHNYPEVNFDIKNSILTVKQVPGGRVVVAPTGHTLAYSTAKSIWDEIRGRGHGYLTNRVTAGEHIRGHHWRHTSFNLTIEKNHVTIGCQRIPMQAISDLAEREGWK